MAEHPELDLTTPTSIHVIGVGGAGMSALAIALAQMGHQVSGSDLRDTPVLHQLRSSGVTVSVGHREENLGSAKWVTASPAVSETNVELTSARRQDRFVLTRAQALGALTRVAKTLAVTGTHGKTTTSAMLSLILVHAKMKPSFIIGAELTGLGITAQYTKGSPLVLEADESYGSFSEIEPWMTGITNVEADHLDHYGDLEHLEQAFLELCWRTSGPVVVNNDDLGARRIANACNAIRLGSTEDNDARISDVQLERASSTLSLGLPDGTSLRIQIAAPGRHNVANASLAGVMASLSGVKNDDIVNGLQHFAGVPRRYEFRGVAGGVTFVDDYAHLPSEVSATVDAASAGGFNRVVAVFQPHRYSRTSSLAHEFGNAFGAVDLVVIAPLYSAGEEPIPGVSAKLIADAVAKERGAETVVLVGSDEEMVETVHRLLAPGDLCLTMGAGDLTALPDLLIERRR